MGRDATIRDRTRAVQSRGDAGWEAAHRDAEGGEWCAGVRSRDGQVDDGGEDEHHARAWRYGELGLSLCIRERGREGRAAREVEVFDLTAFAKVATVDVGQQASGISFWKMDPVK